MIKIAFWSVIAVAVALAGVLVWVGVSVRDAALDGELAGRLSIQTTESGNGIHSEKLLTIDRCSLYEFSRIRPFGALPGHFIICCEGSGSVILQGN